MLTKRDEPVALLGESPAIVALRREIHEAARTNAKVLQRGIRAIRRAELIFQTASVGRDQLKRLVNKHLGGGGGNGRWVRCEHE